MRHDADIYNYGNWNHESALHVAAETGHLVIVRDLLDWYGNVNHAAITLETPLHSAVHEKAYKVAKILVKEYDADMDTFDYHGRTPFHCAIEDEIEDLVHYFINYDEEINA